MERTLETLRELALVVADLHQQLAWKQDIIDHNVKEIKRIDDMRIDACEECIKLNRIIDEQQIYIELLKEDVTMLNEYGTYHPESPPTDSDDSDIVEFTPN